MLIAGGSVLFGDLLDSLRPGCRVRIRLQMDGNFCRRGCLCAAA